MKIDLGLTDPCMHYWVDNCDTHRVAQNLPLLSSFGSFKKIKITKTLIYLNSSNKADFY